MNNETFRPILITYILIAVVCSNILSQKSMICFKVGIPNNIGDTFYSDWKGIINVGLKYSNLRKQNLYLNLYFNYDRLNDTQYDWKTYQTLYKIGLGLQYKFRLSESIGLYSHLGIGYVYQTLKSEMNHSGFDNSGINLLTEIEILYKIMRKLSLGFGIRYDFVSLAVPDYTSDLAYYRRIHAITPTVQMVLEL